MNRNTKFFLASLLLSIVLGIGINNLEERLSNFFFWSEIAKNPEVLAAKDLQTDVLLRLTRRKPEKISAVENLTLEGKAALSAFIDQKGKVKILYEKNGNLQLPIASLTKLMTALVVIKYEPLEKETTISKKAIQKEENFGNFRVGERFKIKDLLYSMLIESSNDAAAALAEVLGESNFIQLMNLEARTLELRESIFFDIAGVDPDNLNEGINKSSTNDLLKLAIYIKENYPEIFSILSLSERDLYTLEGRFHHTMKNTNELLNSNGWPTRVLGGKTGWTPLARGNLLLILESPTRKGYLVNIVLGSEDRFREMKRLVDWIFFAYDF